MDADYDPVADQQRKDMKKKKKKNNKLAQALSAKKPVFDPSKVLLLLQTFCYSVLLISTLCSWSSQLSSHLPI